MKLKNALLVMALLAIAFVGGLIGGSMNSAVHAQDGAYAPPQIFVNGQEVIPMNNEIDINTDFNFYTFVEGNMVHVQLMPPVKHAR